MTVEFDIDAFHEQHPNALPMFVLESVGNLVVCSTDAEINPIAGQTIIAMVDAPEPVG